MTGVTVPVSGGARIRTQALLPQPLLPVLSLDPSLPSLKSWVLGRGGGVSSVRCPSVGARQASVRVSVPYPPYHHSCAQKASVNWRPSNYASKM